MRTIKFRGKRLDNSQWIYGYLTLISGNTAYIRNIEVKRLNVKMVDVNTIGQFTGLYDKKGKEIFEGDIVRYYDDVEDELVVRPVEYLNDYCAFCAVHPRKDPDGLFAQWQYEVVGNIYDNKEQKGGNTDGED